MKYLVTVLLLFLFLNPAVSQIRKSKKQLEVAYRKYFFSRCLVLGIGNGKAFDNDISDVVYEQDAGEIFSTTHGKKIDSLAHSFLSSITPFSIADYEGKKPVFMRCLEFYESKRLSQEIKKIIASPKK